MQVQGLSRHVVRNPNTRSRLVGAELHNSAAVVRCGAARRWCSDMSDHWSVAYRRTSRHASRHPVPLACTAGRRVPSRARGRPRCLISPERGQQLDMAG